SCARIAHEGGNEKRLPVGFADSGSCARIAHEGGNEKRLPVGFADSGCLWVLRIRVGRRTGGGGESERRTHEGVSPLPHFECGASGHSAISPRSLCIYHATLRPQGSGCRPRCSRRSGL